MAKLIRIVTVAAAACLASACIKGPIKPAAPTTPASPSAPAETAGTYQEAIVPGTSTITAGVIRVNVATGATVIAFGAPSQFAQIPDLAIPAGQYHISVWSQPQNGDGTLNWGAVRFDKVSGRVWMLSGSNPTYNWLEVTSPK
jgi:hypothetical protein